MFLLFAQLTKWLKQFVEYFSEILRKILPNILSWRKYTLITVESMFEEPDKLMEFFFPLTITDTGQTISIS